MHVQLHSINNASAAASKRYRQQYFPSQSWTREQPLEADSCWWCANLAASADIPLPVSRARQRPLGPHILFCCSVWPAQPPSPMSKNATRLRECKLWPMLMPAWCPLTCRSRLTNEKQRRATTISMHTLRHMPCPTDMPLPRDRKPKVRSGGCHCRRLLVFTGSGRGWISGDLGVSPEKSMPLISAESEVVVTDTETRETWT
eukprot:scaffold11301_cov29-Prasinocladus_malaysianus.AAC.1